MRNVLFSLHKNSLATLSRSLDAYHDELAKNASDYCCQMNSQPKETADLVRNSPDYRELLDEIKQVNLLKKQVAYQKRLSGKSQGE